MKKITSLLFLLFIISCKNNDFKNQTLSYSNIDKNGGKTFLDLKIDSLGVVTGSKGYEYGERITGYRDIIGKLNGEEIIGNAYDENKDVTTELKINLSKDYAEYFEQNREMIKLSLNNSLQNESSNNESSNNESKEETEEETEESITCENENVLKQLTEMMRENGVRGAKVIKGYTIRRDSQTSNCDCEARLEGEYWVKDGSAPLDRHSVKEPKIRYTLYKNYEGKTIIEITKSDI